MAASHATIPCRLCQAATLPSTVARTGGLCLDCFHAEAKRLAQAARASAPGCAACDGSNQATVYSFDWDRAIRGEGEDSKYPKFLRQENSNRRGARYACTACGTSWFLQEDSRGARMRRVPAACLAAFDAWYERPLVCPDSILEAAHGIGATPPDVYGNGRGEAWIPCRVDTRQGERIDFAMLRFSPQPPISRVDRKPEVMPVYRSVEEVAHISPSRFALPRRVRFRTAWVFEQRMNWAPTAVVSSRGRRFFLNGRTDFFHFDGVVGSDLRLAWRTDGARPAPDPTERLTIFCGDWFKGADALYIAAPTPADWLWKMLQWRWARFGA